MTSPDVHDVKVERCRVDKIFAQAPLLHAALSLLFIFSPAHTEETINKSYNSINIEHSAACHAQAVKREKPTD